MAMDDMDIGDIDARLLQLREEKRLRLVQQKKREIRRRYMAENSFRAVENRIKYMVGGMVLSVWGKSKALQALEKTSMEDSQKKAVEEYTLHYLTEIRDEIGRMENRGDAAIRTEAVDGIVARHEAREKEGR